MKVTLLNPSNYNDIDGKRKKGLAGDVIDVNHTEALELLKLKAIKRPEELKRVVVEEEKEESFVPSRRSKKR